MSHYRKLQSLLIKLLICIPLMIISFVEIYLPVFIYQYFTTLHLILSLVSISLYLSYLSCLSYEKNS